VRCAVVGFGGIAERAHLPALRARQIHIEVVVEPLLARQRVAQLACPEAQLCAELTPGLRLAAAAGVDFVLVCTPPTAHFEALATALELGMHALGEKPLVLRLADMEALTQLAAANDRVLGCVNNWTAAPILRRAWAVAKEHALGSLKGLDQQTWRTQAAGGAASNWRVDPKQSGGGILFDHGWHGLSILLRSFAAAAEPQQLTAQLHAQGRPIASVPGAAEDRAKLSMAYADGRWATYAASWEAPERANRLTFTHANGIVQIDNGDLRAWGQQNTLLLHETFSPSLAEGGYRPDWMLSLLDEFLEEIGHPAHRGRLLRESTAVLKILEAAYAQARGNGSKTAA
jgi:predicted dehydrogenase